MSILATPAAGPLGVSPDWVTAVATVVAALASSLIAGAALLFSIVSFRKQQLRADQQQVRAEELASAQIKPLLWIQRQMYVDLKSMQLGNFGLGPAVIKRAEFTKPGRKPTNAIVELFSIRKPGSSEHNTWEFFAGLPEKRAIAAQEGVVLIKESLEHLSRQGIGLEDGFGLLRKWGDQAKEIEVEIEYEDIQGKAMEPLKFRWD